MVRTMFASIPATITPVGQVLLGHDPVALGSQIIIDPLDQSVVEFDVLFHPFLFSISDFRFSIRF
jgi:hypothetical protein